VLLESSLWPARLLIEAQAMAIVLSITHGDQIFTAAVAPSELDLAISVAATDVGLKSALSKLFGDGDAGEWRTATPGELRAAAQAALDSLTRSGKGGVYRYAAKVQYAPGFPASRAQNVGGIQIGGAHFVLRTGVDLCELVRLQFDTDGTAHEIERRDVRNLRTIATDNWGPVGIVKSGRPIGLAKEMKRIIDFLSRIDGGALVRIALGWVTPSTARRVERGRG
jgi:hypothetical protein